VDQLLTHLQTAQQQRAAAVQQKVQADMASFQQSHEFFDDVRRDMGDLMEMFHNRGVALSLDEAYDKAVKLHPEISAVLQQREAAKAAGNAQASTQRAKDASSSVRSNPAGATSAAPGDTLRGAIEAAYSAASRR